MLNTLHRRRRQMAARIHAPSRAMVVALLALFVAMGGTTYAAVTLRANSVGTKQLKEGAVATRKTKNGAVTGAKVKARSLIAKDNATHAGTAVNAANADALGGQNPASYRDHCSLLNEVAGSTTAAGGECFEANERSPDTYWNAILTCAAAGGRLPTAGELAMYALQDPIPNHDIPFEEWVDSAYFASIDTGEPPAAATPEYYALIFSTSKIGNTKVDHEAVTAAFPFRCVGSQSN